MSPLGSDAVVQATDSNVKIILCNELIQYNVYLFPILIKVYRSCDHNNHVYPPYKGETCDG